LQGAARNRAARHADQPLLVHQQEWLPRPVLRGVKE
jgi:hypothetical protein